MDIPSVTTTLSHDRPCHPQSPPSVSSSTTTCSDRSFPSACASGSGDSSIDYNHSSNHFRQQSTSSGISPCLEAHAGQVAAPSSTSRRNLYPLSSDNHAIIHNNGHSSPADSRFDSLQDLLERAGYKETRVVTPDRQSLAGMFAKKLATPPRKPRLVDDFSSDSPSLAASELRRAIQKSAAAGRSTPKSAATSKSLPSRNYKLATHDDPSSAPPLPNAQTSTSSWFSNIWLFGPGTILNDATSSASTSDSQSKPSSQVAATQQAELEITTASPSLSNAVSASTSTTRVPPTTAKRTATNNPVWTASVAYRSAKSRTAPVRKSAAISSDVLSSDAAAEEAWKALHNAGSNGTAKRRPGLVDAFSSPTKKPASGGKACESQRSPSQGSPSQGSPRRQRKWRQERAAWRESLGDLQAMMDQSRMRREAAAAAVEADKGAVDGTAALVESTTSATNNGASNEASTAGGATDVESAPVLSRTDDDAVAKLLSRPALPFLSTDPAVAPRNASCTRPTHLSMRRMKSVEVLSKIMRERRTVIRSPSDAAPSLPSQTDGTSFEVDSQAGQISPTLKKRSTPPRLTVSSPRGISSPKELALEGHEFEPTSWSPSKCEGAIIISNRKVQKKPRSKLRQVSSGSDLRSAAATAAAAAAAENGLKISRRGRSKSRAGAGADSPSKTMARGPVAALIRGSAGTLSRGRQIAALRNDVHVFDDNIAAMSGADDSPTRRRSERVLALSHASNYTPQATPTPDDVDDIFRPSPSLRKKDLSARITRTSKIMRLIEEAENIPSIASMISTRQPPPRPISTSSSSSTDFAAAADPGTGQGLSSSLSRKSRDRMHTITRVLGQKQPLASS
ncbi:hypothetical protein EX895_005592 [Sporisorium graminicola]|uniref:Uncharacterized protein n=1 Tax=Sporisorium graminicola TaxID=280036 RepID=A0A4U7KME8_9BASI|nr:hypothetical protein EX895_005592 [Sporisorium graminicola]TKY85430.1 hypothetical protein EX895_005592 [Sporisorium graminicola]